MEKKQQEKRSKYDGVKLSKKAFLEACGNGESNFSGADLSGLDLSGLNLSGFDLSGAKLIGTNLNGAHLEGAYLNKAELHDALLNEALLTGTHLNGAYLNGAYLIGAHLVTARLNGAHLVGANLNGANLCHARFDELTDFTLTIFEDSKNVAPELAYQRYKQTVIYLERDIIPCLADRQLKDLSSIILEYITPKDLWGAIKAAIFISHFRRLYKPRFFSTQWGNGLDILHGSHDPLRLVTEHARDGGTQTRRALQEMGHPDFIIEEEPVSIFSSIFGSIFSSSPNSSSSSSSSSIFPRSSSNCNAIELSQLQFRNR